MNAIVVLEHVMEIVKVNVIEAAADLVEIHADLDAMVVLVLVLQDVKEHVLDVPNLVKALVKVIVVHVQEHVLDHVQIVQEQVWDKYKRREYNNGINIKKRNR